MRRLMLIQNALTKYYLFLARYARDINNVFNFQRTEETLLYDYFIRVSSVFYVHKTHLVK